LGNHAAAARHLITTRRETFSKLTPIHIMQLTAFKSPLRTRIRNNNKQRTHLAAFSRTTKWAGTRSNKNTLHSLPLHPTTIFFSTSC